MPKSTLTELAVLRATVFMRDGGCMWPGCDRRLTDELGVNPIQLAHLTHRGMGGSRERNTPENCVALCLLHHDCLDGRTGLGVLRYELNVMLKAQF